MAGFEPLTLDVGSNRSTNLATATAPKNPFTLNQVYEISVRLKCWQQNWNSATVLHSPKI